MGFVWGFTSHFTATELDLNDNQKFDEVQISNGQPVFSSNDCLKFGCRKTDPKVVVQKQQTACESCCDDRRKSSWHKCQGAWGGRSDARAPCSTLKTNGCFELTHITHTHRLSFLITFFFKKRFKSDFVHAAWLFINLALIDCCPLKSILSPPACDRRVKRKEGNGS